jgi:hypothetical protein
MGEEFISKLQHPIINNVDIVESEYITNQLLINSIVEQQILNLNNLDFNIINELDSDISTNTLMDILYWVNENYISIPNLESILQSPDVIRQIGTYVYSLFTTELLTIILPSILIQLGINDPSLLNTANNEAIKTTLQQIILNKILVLSELYNKTDNNEFIYDEMLKWTFFNDLFDTNIDSFIEDTFKLIVNSYSALIYSNMIEDEFMIES